MTAAKDYAEQQQYACASNDFTQCLKQHCDCWHEEGQPNQVESALIKLTTIGKAFVKSVLPNTYEVTAQRRPLGIRCVSTEGIRQDGDAEDDEQWGYTMAAFRQHFGAHLLEVNHSVNFCHTDFTIYLADPTRHEAPSPHGLKALGAGFFAALLLGSLLQGCAGPARLPLSATTKSAPHDPRTKTVEPALVKPVR